MSDLLLASQAGPGAIDFALFERHLERLGLGIEDEPTWTRDERLAHRGLLTREGRAYRATAYGLLAFTPGAHTETRAFGVRWRDATTRGAGQQLLETSVTGRLDELAGLALKWIVERLARDDAGRSSPHFQEALFEVLLNAVCHRDYRRRTESVLVELFDDRVVVESPGPLCRPVSSIDAGGTPRKPNEPIVHVLRTAGLVEGRGRGWSRIKRAMRDHNGTVPLLEEDRAGRFVRVTLTTRAPEMED